MPKDIQLEIRIKFQSSNSDEVIESVHRVLDDFQEPYDLTGVIYCTSDRIRYSIKEYVGDEFSIMELLNRLHACHRSISAVVSIDTTDLLVSYSDNSNKLDTLGIYREFVTERQSVLTESYSRLLSTFNAHK